MDEWGGRLVVHGAVAIVPCGRTCERDEGLSRCLEVGIVVLYQHKIRDHPAEDISSSMATHIHDTSKMLRQLLNNKAVRQVLRQFPKNAKSQRLECRR